MRIRRQSCNIPVRTVLRMTRIRYLVAAVLAPLLVLAGTTPALAISDGSDATESYPFMGAYKPGYPKTPGPGGNGCGVTLIDAHWGLTAAHCRKNNLVSTGTPKGWTVQFGSADVTEGGEVATVSRFFRLPEGTEPVLGEDLMLLRFDEPVSQTPIPLASARPKVGTAVRFLGWGNDASPGEQSHYPTMLKEFDARVLDNADCPTIERASEMCAGDGDGKTGNADSGGPLLVRVNGGWALAGILTGSEDQNPEVSGLFTDVTAHADWIRTVMSTYESIPDDVVPHDPLAGYPGVGPCASSIVRAAASTDEDHALLLTNGHCTPAVDPSRDIPQPGAFELDRSSDSSVPFKDEKGYLLTTSRTERLLFATMTGTDLALYRLDASYADLESQGVTVLDIAAAPPKIGDVVTLQADEGLTCTVETVVPTLREGEYELYDSLRLAKGEDCETYHGTSGAALVAADGKTIVGVNSSSNTDGEKCTEDNPCEVGADGKISVHTDQAYARQVTVLNDCIAAGSVFDVDAPGCTLAAAARGEEPLNVPLLVGGAVFGLGIVALAWALVAQRRRRRHLIDQTMESGSTPTA